jgi:hypothetical protein
MSQFITISKYPGDAGQITTCTGKLFVTTANKKQIILCSSSFVSNDKTILTTHTQELAYRSTDTVNFVPKGAAEQGAIYPGTEITAERERTWMYATNSMSISGLLSNGQVVATSKIEPLVLYYRYSNGKLGLYFYNLEDGTTTQITSKTVSSISSIDSCQFAVGAFASSKQQDIFASCNLLDVTNGFFIKAQQETSAQANQYQMSDRGLGDWCSNNNNQATNNIIILGDFNGDKLSDLLCLNTRSAMINKGSSFRETNLIKNLPGNWVDQLSASNNQNGQNRFAIGDYDGNGLSDLASITNGAKPEILYHNSLNDFVSYTGDRNNDGSFTLNRLNQWCGTDANAQVIAIDADNDGVDDVLCKSQGPAQQNNDANTTSVDHGKVFLAISRTSPYTPAPDQALGRVIVSLNDFTIRENLGYVITDKNVPLFCDARIYEYHTKTSCSLNSPNKVQDFTTPIRLSNAIPELEVNAEVKGNIFLGDKDRYGEIDLVNEQVLNEGAKSHFPKAKFWKWDSVNYVDPSRHFETKVQTHYIRQGKISEDKQHLSDHSYGYRVHGGDCNEINFSHITLTNNFTAFGQIEAYDQNNNKITDRGLLRNLAEMYILSGISANSNNQTTAANVPNAYNAQSQIENVGSGVVTFSFTGTMKLQTLYQKNITHCSVKKIKQSDLLANDNQGTAVASSASAAPNQISENSAVCLLQSDNPFLYAESEAQAPSITKSPSLLRRSDALELNGIIHAGGAFFPGIIKNATATAFEIDRYGTQIDDLHSKLNYNNSIELHAYLRDNPDSNTKYFDRKPHNELMIEFKQNANTLYEPTKIKFANGTLSTTPASLYAGFDNIKQVKLAAFDAKHILLAWSIYQAQEKQYYLLVDYVNTGNSLLKIPLYEKDFSIIITNKRYGNEFYVAYRTNPSTLVVAKYSAENFALTRSVEVAIGSNHNNARDIESAGNTKFEIQVEELTTDDGIDSNLVIVRSHNNNQGQFIKKFDIFLNEVGVQANIICDASQSGQNTQSTVNTDALPTKIDDGYDVLKLNYKHNSKVVYHSTDRNYNLDKKVKLQNGLNFIYRGAEYLQTQLANPDQETQTKIRNSLEGILCRSSLPYESLGAVTKHIQNLLASDLTYEIHTDTSNPNCKGNSYYPTYRVGNAVHICSGFDTITDNMSECNRLIDGSEYVKGFVAPETPQVQASILANLIPFLPSNVISSYTNIINSDYTSPGDKASICHEAGAYGDPSQTQYANHIANNIVAGLLSRDGAKFKVSLGTDFNSCNNMAARGCSTSYDKQANILCVSNLFEIVSTASLVAEAAQTNQNIRYNCQTGCDLNNPALTKLAGQLGGYLTQNIDREFIQKDNNHILKQVGQTSSETRETSSVATSTTTYTTSTDKVLTATPTYFYDKNSSLITFAHLGNDYIDLKAQYFRLNSTDPISIEQHLGRFLNVKQIQTVAFNQSAVLVGYSVKHPSQSDYNIFVQYITPTTAKIVNIYPSYNGIFALDTVPYDRQTAQSQEQNQQSVNNQPAISDTEFMVSYPESSTILSSKRYKITKNNIADQKKVEETVQAIPANTDDENSNRFTVNVNAFLDNTFNVIWSYLDQAGIFIQKYNLFSGDKTEVTEILATEENNYPQILRTDADKHNKTLLTWQNQGSVFLKMFTQTALGSTINYKALNFTAGNYSLQRARILDDVSDLVSITLQDVNNSLKVKKVIANAGSDELSLEGFLYENEEGLYASNASSPRAITSNSNSATTGSLSTKLLDKILGTIKNLNINTNQQCSANPSNNIQDLLKQSQDLLKNKPELIQQIQSVLTGSDLRESLNKLGIDQGIVYSIINKLNSIEDLQKSINDLQNTFTNLNISNINDVDFSVPLNASTVFEGIDSIKLKEEFGIDIQNFLNNQALQGSYRRFQAQSTQDTLLYIAIAVAVIGIIATGVCVYFRGPRNACLGIIGGTLGFLMLIMIIRLSIPDDKHHGEGTGGTPPPTPVPLPPSQPLNPCRAAQDNNCPKLYDTGPINTRVCNDDSRLSLPIIKPILISNSDKLHKILSFLIRQNNFPAALNQAYADTICKNDNTKQHWPDLKIRLEQMNHAQTSLISFKDNTDEECGGENRVQGKSTCQEGGDNFPAPCACPIYLCSPYYNLHEISRHNLEEFTRFQILAHEMCHNAFLEPVGQDEVYEYSEIHLLAERCDYQRTLSSAEAISFFLQKSFFDIPE